MSNTTNVSECVSECDYDITLYVVGNGGGKGVDSFNQMQLDSFMEKNKDKKIRLLCGGDPYESNGKRTVAYPISEMKKKYGNISKVIAIMNPGAVEKSKNSPANYSYFDGIVVFQPHPANKYGGTIVENGEVVPISATYVAFQMEVDGVLAFGGGDIANAEKAFFASKGVPVIEIETEAYPAVAA
jgi:hypothetical protein